MPSDEEHAGWWSLLTFSYYSPMFKLGAQQPLSRSDLPELISDDQAGPISDVFEERWRQECETRTKPSLLRVLYGMTRWPLFLGGVAGLFQLCSSLLSPILVKRFIQFFGNPDESIWVGVGLCFALLCSSTVFAFSRNQGWRQMYHLGIRVNAAVLTSLYRKSMRLSNASWGKHSVGQVLNMVTSDSQILFSVIPHLHMSWVMVLMLIAVIVLTWQEIGLISTAVALGTMIFFIPVNAVVARVVHRASKKQLVATDERLLLTNDFLQGIRLAKAYVWEDAFIDTILGVRSTELRYIRRLYILQAFSRLLMATSPFVVMLSAFGSYWALGLPITAEVIFTTVALLNMLRAPLNFIPMLLGYMVFANVVMGRIGAFLRGEERSGHVCDEEDDDVHVGIWDGVFQWKTIDDAPQPQDDDAIALHDVSLTRPTLRDVSVGVTRGSLAMVFGAVSSGKSSLLSALLGEMTKLNGRVRIPERVAYVGQTVWLSHGTIRDNILLGRPLDVEWYDRVVEACALLPDLAILPGGDQAEIGERGITLSGGQKVRVALARAVYSAQNTDVFLFDDVFSSLDADVGRQVFDSLLRDGGLLRGEGKTVLLATNQLHLASSSDRIVFLSDGTVSEQGTYTELMAAESAFATLAKAHVSTDGRKAGTVGEEEDNESEERSSEESTAGTPLMSEEEQMHGAVPASIYTRFLANFGGPLMWTMFFLFASLSVLSQTLAQLWLAIWTGGSPFLSIPVLPGAMYLAIYGGMIGLSVVLGSSKEFVFVLGFIRGVKCLHEGLLARIARVPVFFFDTTPLGRILNRFSKDCFHADRDIQQRLGDLLMLVLRVLSVLVLLSVIEYWLPLVIVPFTVWYYREQKYFRASARELQRLDSISKSPVFSHFTESIHGITTIRAFGLSETYSRHNAGLVDENHRAFVTVRMASRWLDLHLSVVGVGITFAAALFAVLQRDRLGASLGGLVMSLSASLVATVSMFINNIVEIENRMTSVERIVEFSRLPIEGDTGMGSTPPPCDWPESGRIDVDYVSLRYRDGLPLALEDLSFSIQAGENVGICGRTGSGKSTVLSALLRLTEIEAGSIKVDGVDIHTMDVRDARAAFFIIPQSPTIFNGTVRYNLDPMGAHTDSECWTALAQSQLDAFVRGLPSQLDTVLHSGAGGHTARSHHHSRAPPSVRNGRPIDHSADAATSDTVGLSSGQRQLFCLARALLRRPKIVLLDEATSNVDLATERLVLATMQKGLFQNATSIVVAHRLTTILGMDRVMVMDGGRVVESGPPAELKEREGSEFRRLLDASE